MGIEPAGGAGGVRMDHNSQEAEVANSFVASSKGKDSNQIRDNAKKTFEAMIISRGMSFQQFIPGTASPAQLIQQLIDKAKNASNDADPAAADLDTGE